MPSSIVSEDGHNAGSTSVGTFALTAQFFTAKRLYPTDQGRRASRRTLGMRVVYTILRASPRQRIDRRLHEPETTLGALLPTHNDPTHHRAVATARAVCFGLRSAATLSSSLAEQVTWCLTFCA